MSDDLTQLATRLERVESELAHFKETFKSRYEALNAGQELLITKVDGFKDLVNNLASGAEQSPAGRALTKEIDQLTKRGEQNSHSLDAHTMQLKNLEAFQNEVRGAVSLLKFIGLSSAILAIIAIFRAFLH